MSGPAGLRAAGHIGPIGHRDNDPLCDDACGKEVIPARILVRLISVFGLSAGSGHGPPRAREPSRPGRTGGSFMIVGLTHPRRFCWPIRSADAMPSHAGRALSDPRGGSDQRVQPAGE
jgi:hypothetical protein